MAATSAHVLARLWQTAIQILRTLQRLVNTIRAPTDALASVFCQKCLEPSVERVRLEELAALSDEEALNRTLSLRLFVPWTRAVSDWSGLIEQQALFHGTKPT